MANTNYTHKLRHAVNKSLHNCLRDATPFVCGMAETEQGYLLIEKQIINMCLKQNITPQTAIAIIESELSNNE